MSLFEGHVVLASLRKGVLWLLLKGIGIQIKRHRKKRRSPDEAICDFEIELCMCDKGILGWHAAGDRHAAVVLRCQVQSAGNEVSSNIVNGQRW